MSKVGASSFEGAPHILRNGSSGVNCFGFLASREGAIGEWAMTCEGGATGIAAIAHFTVTTPLVDP